MSDDNPPKYQSFFDIPYHLTSQFTHITDARDKVIEDAIQTIGELVAGGSTWQLLLVQRDYGMLLLRRGLQGSRYSAYGTWFHTPACGAYTPEAVGTAEIIRMLALRNHTVDSILSGYVAIYNHFKVRDLDTIPVCEPV